MITSDPFLADVILPTHDCPPGASAIEDWEAEHSSEFGDSSPWSGALDYEERTALRQLREALAVRSVSSNRQRYLGRVFAELLAKHGLSFDEMAERCNARPEQVASLFCRSDDLIASTLAVERHIRSGEWDGSMETLANYSEVSVNSLHRSLLPALGIESTSARNRRAGGGLKYGPEQYEAIRKFREEDGRSYGWIGKEMAMDRTTVARICNRRGWKLPKA